MKISKGLTINAMLLLIVLLIPTTYQSNTQHIREINIVEASTLNYETAETTARNLTLTVNSDVRVLSNLTAEEFNQMLAGTKLYGIGKALQQAEKDYQINGLYLLGLACLESAYGESGYAIQRNNLVGWAAYDNNPDNASYFNSKEECILYVAKFLKEHWLNENDWRFEGYTPRAIDVHYCTDKLHADKIVNIVNNRITLLNNN